MRTAAMLVLLLTLITTMVLLQNRVLDQSEEMERENIHTRLTDLPAKDMVPTYIGSLFLGSFRALAIDVFWIQLKAAQKERRWYQAREIMEMISKLQPHNEEVWSMLAWDSAYNIANSEEQISHDRAWKWIRYGLLKLREGIRVNPRSPYLTFELARMLQHKPSWNTGILDPEFLSRIERDDEIQEQLQLPSRDGTKTAFELSILWFKETIRRLRVHKKTEDLFFRTQMGLYLHETTMESFIRDAMYLQAIHRWNEARRKGPDAPEWKEADLWLERAENQVRKMTGQFDVRSISEEQAAFYHELRTVFMASRAFYQNRNGNTLQAYVSEMEKLMIRFGPIDGRYVQNVLSQFRQDLSREEYGPGKGSFIDRNEFNDTHPFATPLEEDHPLYGNFFPLYDADSFSVWIPVSGRPVLHVKTWETRLQVTVALENKPPLLTKTIERNTTADLPFEARSPGRYHVDVRPADPAAPRTTDTRYRIEVEGVPSGKKPGPNQEHRGHDH